DKVTRNCRTIKCQIQVNVTQNSNKTQTTVEIQSQHRRSRKNERVQGPWVRRILIRVINIVPTSIAISLGYDPLILLVYSQVILSFLIPLPMIPLILFTRSKEIMGNFVNRNITTILAVICTIIIIGLNAYLIITSI